MSNKKFTKLAVLSLLGILGLTACSSSDEIYAKPSNYEKPIVTITGSEEKIHNDILSIIYDAMHEGSASSKTLDIVMFKYAESVFGTFDKVTKKKGNYSDDTISLAEAYDDAHNVGGDQSKVKAFIKAHKSYWLRNDNGEHIDDDGNVIAEDSTSWTPGAREINNVTSKFDAIGTRIAETMYSKATSGSYTKKHFFDEYEFVKALYKDGKDVDFYKARLDHEDGTLKPVIVEYTLEKEDVFDIANGGILHEEYYVGDAAKACTYIQDEIISSIYNDLLVEQYLLDEELASVRNSRARYINVIKIEKYSSFTNNADALIKHLVHAIYSETWNESHVRFKADDINAHYKELFDLYATVNKGLYSEISGNAAAEAIVADLQLIASDIYEVKTSSAESGSKNYYNNTTYGDLVKDYEKFLKADNYNDLDMSLYNKFTSTGTVTPEEGFDQATIDIDQTQTITKGWYINNSQPSLDSNGEINKRLFKLSVANAKEEIADNAGDNDAHLNALEQLDRFEKVGGVWQQREAPLAGEDKFLCSINGAYFLRFEGQYSEDDPFNDIVYDDGSAYYIVNVVEAAKDNKLSSKGNNSYSKTRSADFLNEVVEEISKKVAETGSYASLSKEYWLKKMDIKYHDQKVYDYFKENYPDLFE